MLYACCKLVYVPGLCSDLLMLLFPCSVSMVSFFHRLGGEMPMTHPAIPFPAFPLRLTQTLNHPYSRGSQQHVLKLTV